VALDLEGSDLELRTAVRDRWRARTDDENLRFADPQASDDEVSRITQMVGLDAGERQLISIGRALLADPRILIFDEATSNIDRPTELLIERALDRLLHRRTSIIIAHRLSTARRADRIVVIDRGDIVQQGTGAELLAVDGPFRRLADAHLLGAQ
jgi:ATP-binding cassette, subfamily B, bacterial